MRSFLPRSATASRITVDSVALRRSPTSSLLNTSSMTRYPSHPYCSIYSPVKLIVRPRRISSRHPSHSTCRSLALPPVQAGSESELRFHSARADHTRNAVETIPQFDGIAEIRPNEIEGGLYKSRRRLGEHEARMSIQIGLDGSNVCFGHITWVRGFCLVGASQGNSSC